MMGKTDGIVNPSFHYSSKDGGSKIDIESNHNERAATITGHNIRYSVDVKTKPCCGEVQKKEILKGIK